MRLRPDRFAASLPASQLPKSIVAKFVDPPAPPPKTPNQQAVRWHRQCFFFDMHRKGGAFSLFELLVFVGVVALIAALILPQLARSPRRSDRLNCVVNLKNIGLAFRIFATDNNDLYPGAIRASNTALTSIDIASLYRDLSNELSTPKLLSCPNEAKRKPAESFTNLYPRNISYFASISAAETMPTALLAGDRNLQTNGVLVGPGLFSLMTNTPLSWSEELHNQEGNVAMADGSVQMIGSNRVKQVLSAQALATNFLVIP